MVVDGHTSYSVLVPQDNVFAEQDTVLALAQITNAASDQVNGKTDSLWQSVYCVFSLFDCCCVLFCLSVINDNHNNNSNNNKNNF